MQAAVASLSLISIAAAQPLPNDTSIQSGISNNSINGTKRDTFARGGKH